MDTKSPMRFRARYALTDTPIELVDETPVAFTFPGAAAPVVTIWVDDPALTDENRRLECVVEINRNVGERNRSHFRQLLEGRMPEGSYVSDDLNYTSSIEPDGTILPNRTPPLRYFPDSFQTLASDVQRSMSDCAQRTIDLICWRYGNHLGRARLAARGTSQWSFEGDEWRSLPLEFRTLGWAIGYVPLTENSAHPVRQLIAEQAEPPLAYELLREAWALLGTHPRSALVIAVTAAEVGFKQFATELAPDTEWLLQEMPAPPLDKMLREYLPRMRIRQQDQGGKRVTERMLDEIKTAVTQRNQVVHRGTQPSLEHISTKRLRVITDFLYLMDYYRGHDWALEYIQHSTLKELGIERLG